MTQRERSQPVQLVPVNGIGEIEPGDDLAMVVATAAEADGNAVTDGDIVVITSKVVSKAEGCRVDLDGVSPSAFALHWAERYDKDPRVVEVVLQQSRRVVRQIGPVLITETHHGLVCANAGVDQSSAGAPGRVLVLPPDPDRSAEQIRQGLAARGVDVAVIVTDTFGRPWREGQTDVAIGIAGMSPLRSYIGEVDPHGYEFQVQELCVADEIAGAAELVKGNVSRVPVVLVRGFAWEPVEGASMRTVIRDSANDLFR